MYHKRVSGYSAMGYKALRESDYSEKSGIIFDSHNSLPMFNRDMGSSRHEIVICKPKNSNDANAAFVDGGENKWCTNIGYHKTGRKLQTHKSTRNDGVDSISSRFRNNRYSKADIHQKFAVIDQNTVWNGSINLMSHDFAEKSIIRFENMEIAGELLTTVEQERNWRELNSSARVISPDTADGFPLKVIGEDALLGV